MKPIVFNPIVKEHKSPVGAVMNGDDIIITIHITRDYQIHNLQLEIKNDENHLIQINNFGEINRDEFYIYYQVHFSLAMAGLYWYHFTFEDVYGKHFISANHNLEATLTNYYPVSWQLLIHKPFESNLSWYKGKIMYQIMTDRFNKGANNKPREDVIVHENWNELPIYKPQNGVVLNNDFFGGDLIGIIEKLDYLKGLNVGVIYLNPIFEAYSNHKYDTSDYLKIDSMFGTEEDFKLLLEKAKEKNIEIILDGVFNHTGDDSIYFNKKGKYSTLGAYQSKDSPYYSWFNFTKYPNKYLSWWGFDTLPSLNQNSQDMLNFFTGPKGVINKWISLGVKGFRLDVVDELEDHFVDRINKSVKDTDKEAIVIGEVWEDASTKSGHGKRRRYLQGGQLDSVMNYPLKDAIFETLKTKDVFVLKRQMLHLVNNYPKYVLDLLMNPLGTHDTVRVINQFVKANYKNMTKEEQANYVISPKEKEEAYKYVKMASALQFTLPGVPSIYYGDEIGMDGFKDPLCRKAMAWDNIDNDLINWYKMLGKLRQNDVFIDGEYREEYIENEVFAFSRKNSKQKIVTILNLSNKDFTYHFEKGFDIVRNQKATGRIHVARNTVRIVEVY